MSVDEMKVTRFKRRLYFEEYLEQVVVEYSNDQTATDGGIPQDVPPLTVPRPIAGLFKSED